MSLRHAVWALVLAPLVAFANGEATPAPGELQGIHRRRIVCVANHFSVIHALAALPGL